jgi:hypothetical protein
VTAEATFGGTSRSAGIVVVRQLLEHSHRVSGDPKLHRLHA